MDGGVHNLQVVVLLVDLGAERQGVNLFDVLRVDVLADNLNQHRVAIKLDFAHTGNGVDVLDDVHIVGRDNLCAVVPVGLVAVIFLGIVRSGDIHTTLATQQADGVGHLGGRTGAFEKVDLDAVCREDIGNRLGKQAAVVSHIVPHDNLDLLQMGESLLHIIGQTLGGRTHGVDVHAIAAGTHDATQAAGAKLQVFVERLDEVGLVVVLEHSAHLLLCLLVVAGT